MNRIKLNSIQYKFWMDNQLKYPSAEYNNANFTFVVEGDLDLELLRESYKRIMLEYPPFCSKVLVEDSIPYFVYEDGFDQVPFEFVNHINSYQEVEQYIYEKIHVPFDLQYDLPCRFYAIGFDNKYYLVNLFNHVALDAISLSFFLNRLSSIYKQLKTDTYQFIGQLELIENFNQSFEQFHLENNERSVKYWKEFIADYPLQLPVPKGSTNTDEPVCFYFEGGKELHDLAEEFCMTNHTTLFRLYSAIWAITLSRTTRNEKLLLDHSVNFRPKGDDTLLGVFVNNLPMRFNFEDSNLSILDILTELRANRHQERLHQDAVYYDILREDSSQESSRTETINVAISYPTRYKTLRWSLDGCKVSNYGHVDVQMSTDLALLVEDDADLTCDIRHNPLIPKSFIESLSKVFVEVLRQVMVNPSMKLKDISLVSESEQQTMLRVEDSQLHLAVKPQCFLQQFKEVASRNPMAVAVEFKDQLLTYAELDHKSDVVASYLVDNQLTHKRIGISTPKCLEMIIGMLGILKAGNSYVPIDYQYPDERIEFITQDSQLEALLTTKSVTNRFAVPSFLIEELQHYTSGDTSVLPVVNPTDEAYVIYTSGTTGKPKGIPIRHANLFQTITTNIEIQQLDDSSRVMQFANSCFDASIVELFPVLTLGGTLVLPTDEVRKDSRMLLSFLEDRQIISLNIPPVLLASLPHRELPALKTIVIGGDTTSAEAISYWSKNRLFINAYGPTENTVDATYSMVKPNSSITDIGTTMPGVTCYVVDKYMHLMPYNMTGELCIGGVKLTDGYIQRPELNDEKFIPNPFASAEDKQKGINTRLYRTGDLAYRRNDGHLIFCGRADFQVKLHGYRIELGDIESQIRKFGDFVANTIVTTYGERENKKLVAYIQTANPDSFNIPELKVYLKQSLPVYMVPSKFIVLKEFLYNTSGKIDRHKLPDPSLFQEERLEFVAPETLTEKTLVELWKKFLPTDQIGRDDDFLALGGDSMGVIQLSFSIEETLKVLVRASDIYNNSTLCALASFIDEQLQGEHQEELSVDEHPSTDTQFPLTPIQLALWLQCAQSEAVKNTYNLPCFFQCPDHVSVEKLEEALNMLVSKQEGFRMSFPLDEKGKPYIHVFDFSTMKFEQIHLHSEQELAAAFQQQMKISFNLEDGPLFTCSLFIVNESRYYCCIILHHLISDGWSAKLIQQTLLDYAAGNQIEWDKFNKGYTTYVRDFNKLSASNVYAQCLSYWEKNLQSISDLEILKSGRDETNDYLADYYECPFPEGLKEAVTEFCNRHVFTPFSVYISLYLMVLARLSRQSDFVVGFPSMGRELGKYSHMVGFFVNTLPLRYSEEYSSLSFLTYVATISKELLDVRENAVSLDKLIKIARSQSEDENMDFVQTIFTYDDKELFHDYIHNEHTSFGLSFSILNDKSKNFCSLTYKKSCLNEQDIKTLVSAFFTLLKSAISSEDTPLKNHSLADEAYCKKIISSNCCTLGLRDEALTRLTVPEESYLTNIQPFLEQFSQVVDQIPEKDALRFNGVSMTYRELDEFSSQIATNIRKAGVPTASSIAVNINASIHSIVVFIGILKAGCCYVPIAEAIPDDRKSLMLEDASCKMLFTNENFPEGECIIEHNESTQSVDFTNCAYIIYTSGTTGKPKGVPITHDSLAHLTVAGAKGYNITSSSRVLLFASISFDESVDEIFIPLSQGATVVIASEEQRMDVNLLSQLMLSEFVTFACIPAALLSLMPHTNFPDLKTLVNGGESANPTVIKKWLGHRQVINAYGPTENTVDATMGIVNEGSEPDDIGLPLTGCTCYVLDEELNIVPDDVEGELHIGGLQLTAGYLNRPDLNSEKFIDNPYVLPEDKASGLNLKLYKSGDIVVRRKNGHLIFRGRKDRQVKLHGYRIELGDIESQIRNFGDFVANTIVTTYGERENKKLVAYIHTANPDSFNIPELKEYLKQSLPVYMVPSKFIVLKEFFYNTSGKIDRHRLPNPSLFQDERLEFVALETSTEKTLVELWKKFLPTDQIGRDDDFMALGGDSMGVIQLSFNIEETFKVLVRASDIYNNSTLRALASFIDEQLLGEYQEELSEDEHTSTDAQLPLTPIQLALWLQCVQSETVKNIYNLPCFFQCPDHVSVAKLEEALNMLVSKQEGFRMSFPLDEKGKPYIRISDFSAIKFEQIHLQSEQELVAAFQQQKKISFNLEDGPLFTCSLFIVNESRYYCCIILHHLISDGWSAKLIQQTLLDYAAGNQIEWDNFNKGYTTYVRDFNKLLASNVYAQRLSYWEKNLQSISDLEILKSGRDETNDYLADYYECPFPEGLKEAVTEFCNRHVFTPFSVYISLYLMVLARLSRQSDFVVGFPSMGRELGNYSHMVGFFVNTLPLRYSEEYSSLSFLTYVTSISKELLDVRENAVSFDKLIKIARSQSDDEHIDFVQAIFTYEDKELLHDYIHNEYTPFGLSFSILNDDSKNFCRLIYKKSCLRTQDVETLVSAFFTLLKSAISSEDIPLKKHSLADEAYCKKIIYSNCCTLGLRDEALARLTVPEESYITNVQPFLEQFIQVVGQMPEKEALRYNGISMTYCELDEFSSQIANKIRKAGVPTSSSIAVNMNASIHSIVVIIGILKAGCCYVPIAEDIPDERKSLMLEDASCKMLFTNENFPEGECIVEQTESTQPVDFTNCAYIIYTSGTTGKPKGVPITHDSLAHLTVAGAKGYGISSSSKVLLFASISFDASIVEIFIPLAQGATIVIASEEQRMDVNLLSQLMLSELVTFATIPAALLPLMPHTNFPELKTLINGGESANPTVIKKWLGNRQVINAYGPTENTVDTTLCIVNDNSEPDDIGLPLTGCTCYVLDEELNIVPDGVEGELHIGGLQLTAGYLNRPDLNSELFVDNPYVLPEDKDNGFNLKLYKSGDIVVRRENGHLIFRGRKDRQIKLHGFRIELAEIEKQILASESVEQVFVQIRKDETTSDDNKSKAELVAYVGSSQEVDLVDLQHQLRMKLPIYMVPTRWAVIDKLPLTMNGKINKRALPEPVYIVQPEKELPMTNDEKLFVKLLRDFFGTDTIGVETDLIELGITSLQFMEFVVYASERSDFHITLSAVYRSRTVRNLVKDLNRKLYFWVNEYDKEKPTFVFICGFPYFRPFYDEMVVNLNGRCNLFIMESYIEYFQNRNSVNLDDLIHFYMDVIKVELQDKPIFAVTGYCVGSEIAIRLATRLKEEGISNLKVLMLEGSWEREVNNDDNLLLRVVTNEAVLQQCLITDKLFKTYSPIKYDGDIIMAFAENMGDKLTPAGGEDISEADIEKVNNSMKENLKKWKKEYPNAPCYVLKADHWTFFEKQHVEFLWDTMKTYWNL